MKILSELSKLYNALSQKYNVILFAENSILYKKFFRVFEINLKKKKIKYLLITLNDNLEKNFNSRKIFNRNYINFQNIDFLKVFFKIVKKKLIISSTPKFNKTISNNSNFFIYIQHSLARLTNKYISNNLKYFDKITLANKDQLIDCLNHLKISKKKFLYYKYHNLDFLDNLKKKNIKKKHKKKIILIATSFYGNNLLNLLNVSFISNLLKKYSIILRPHPETFKDPYLISKLNSFKKKFYKKNFLISSSYSNQNDILNADYLVTDFSGIGLTFSYCKFIPTIFLLKFRSDYKILSENYSKKSLKAIGIISSFCYESLIKNIKYIENKKKFYRKKIEQHKFNQFNFLSKDETIEKFLDTYLTKIS